MQYLLMIYLNEAWAAERTPAQMEEGVAAYMAYTEPFRKAGALVGVNRLARSSAAATIRVSDGKSQVLNGPYAESKEQLAAPI